MVTKTFRHHQTYSLGESGTNYGVKIKYVTIEYISYVFPLVLIDTATISFLKGRLATELCFHAILRALYRT